MFVEDEDAMWLEVEISGNGGAGEEIMHGLIKLDAVRGSIVIEQKINVGVVFVAHADFDLIGHFDQRMDIAELAEPGDEIGVEMLMALGADVNRFAEAEGVHRHGRAAGIKILGVGRKNLAVLRFDDVTP